MDDILKRIINERELVFHLKQVGIKGYSIEKIQGGYLYRFLDKEGEWHEFVNLSTKSQKQLHLDI